MDKNIVKLFLRYHLSLYLCVLFASQICFAQSSALEKVLLLPTVNQKTLPEALLFLKDMQGNYLISQQNWQALGLKLPTNLPLSIDGGSYYRLNDLADIQFEVNPKKSIINLMADARFFSKSTLKYPNSQWIANNNNSKGAYLNYDISLLNQNDTFFQNAFTETVFFNQQFSFEHTVLFKRDDIVNKQTRLNTVASYSLPAKKTTIKIGDYISSTIALGENVRLLGVKFGTDFSLQPDKVYSPQISLSGAAVIPSTVDIFVNNVKKFSQNVPSGEFSIQDIPVVSGQGTAKMVITDIMGRKQEVIQPYYSSPVLLGKGLVDYSYQFGALRQNYGIDSENYDELLTNFSLKYGLSNQLTLDLNSQLLTEQQALTVGAAAAIANWVVVRGLVSASHQSELNEGYAYGLSLEHRNNFLGAGFDTKYYSPKYVHLSNNTVTQPKSASQVFVNQQISQRGSLTANYMQQQYYGQDSVKIAQFGYGLGLKNYGNVNLSAIFSQFGHKKTKYIS